MSCFCCRNNKNQPRCKIFHNADIFRCIAFFLLTCYKHSVIHTNLPAGLVFDGAQDDLKSPAACPWLKVLSSQHQCLRKMKGVLLFVKFHQFQQVPASNLGVPQNFTTSSCLYDGPMYQDELNQSQSEFTWVYCRCYKKLQASLPLSTCSYIRYSQTMVCPWCQILLNAALIPGYKKFVEFLDQIVLTISLGFWLFGVFPYEQTRKLNNCLLFFFSKEKEFFCVILHNYRKQSVRIIS